jgi:hypothetical protein
VRVDERTTAAGAVEVIGGCVVAVEVKEGATLGVIVAARVTEGGTNTTGSVLAEDIFKISGHNLPIAWVGKAGKYV